MSPEKIQNLAASAIVLTAPGPGAVAVIEVSVPRVEQVSLVFQPFSAVPPRELTRTAAGRVVYGRWKGEDLLLVRTANARWEIHCHGGTAAVNRILADLQRAGVKIEPPQGGAAITADDRVTADILQTLSQCRTRKTAGLALAQLDGRLQRLLADVQGDDAARREQALRHIERWKDVAAHLAAPWKIALVGPPNAGKSSLINALAGLDRSIVSSIPGTTRDRVEVEIVVDGWTMQLIDTAGIHDSAASPLEHVGIEQSLQTLQECDLVCVVIDVTDRQLQASLLEPLRPLRIPTAILFNKRDLEPLDAPTLQATDAIPGSIPTLKTAEIFRVSALTGAGLPEFLKWLIRTLIPEEPAVDTALPLDAFLRLAKPP